MRSSALQIYLRHFLMPRGKNSVQWQNDELIAQWRHEISIYPTCTRCLLRRCPPHGETDDLGSTELVLSVQKQTTGFRSLTCNGRIFATFIADFSRFPGEQLVPMLAQHGDLLLERRRFLVERFHGARDRLARFQALIEPAHSDAISTRCDDKGLRSHAVAAVRGVGEVPT